MAFKVPLNQIVYNYTAGGEYIFKTTQKKYQGYYYETNGKTFAGKEFNAYAPELEKVIIKDEKNPRFNPLLSNAATFIYGKVSKFNINNFTPTPVVSKLNINNPERYFTKKINSNPIIIKEINKEDFDKLQSNPIYQTISLKTPPGGFFSNQKSLDEADKIMPGIKDFILSEKAPD